MQKYTGGCHCQAVQYEVEVDLAKTFICNCSHCEMKGFILAFVPATSFTLLSGEDSLTEYRFNSKRFPISSAKSVASSHLVAEQIRPATPRSW